MMLMMLTCVGRECGRLPAGADDAYVFGNGWQGGYL